MSCFAARLRLRAFHDPSRAITDLLKVPNKAYDLFATSHSSPHVKHRGSSPGRGE
ncbi:hypothetical protein VTO73DRAFT_13365 [Trametes versicolor]